MKSVVYSGGGIRLEVGRSNSHFSFNSMMEAGERETGKRPKNQHSLPKIKIKLFSKVCHGSILRILF